MLDVQLFGEWAGGHHLTSLILHFANSALLFFLLRRMTGAFWPSGIVALVFAAHPLHVESVAWIAERKDVLSALFWFLAIREYLKWIEHRARASYLRMVVFYCAGFMAKPMIITLPFTLLLLDYWPLRRSGFLLLIREKLPLFALSAVMAVATYFAQRSAGAVAEAIAIPLVTRIENAAMSYCAYLAQIFWPSHIAVFYPYDFQAPPWKFVAAAILLFTISACAWFSRRERFIVGWLWFLITLLPVIGLVQVGSQAHADRYMYVPMIGLLIAIVWAPFEFTRQNRAATMVAIAICIALGVKAYFQTSVWRDSVTLFQSAIENTDRNYVAYNGLGLALAESGNAQDAVNSFETALRIEPDYFDALVNVSDSLLKLGRTEDAVVYLRHAIRLKPSAREAHVNLASALLKLNRSRDAIREYETAIALAPGDSLLKIEFAKALAADGQIERATARLRETIAANPNLADAHYSLGLIFISAGNMKDAETEFRSAASLDPNDADAHFNLGTTLAAQDKLEQAIPEFEAAIRINQSFVAAHMNLGKALANIGKADQALREFRIVLRLDPSSEEAAEAIRILSQ